MSKIKDILAFWIDFHPVISTFAFGVFVCSCMLLLFWFIVFSGLSSSADFIYSHF